MSTQVEFTDTHLILHGPGVFEVDGWINETIDVDDGRFRQRKLPADQGVVLINDELHEWGTDVPGNPADSPSEALEQESDPTAPGTDDDAPAASEGWVRPRGLVSMTLDVGKNRSPMEFRR